MHQGGLAVYISKSLMCPLRFEKPLLHTTTAYRWLEDSSFRPTPEGCGEVGQSEHPWCKSAQSKTLLAHLFHSKTAFPPSPATLTDFVGLAQLKCAAWSWNKKKVPPLEGWFGVCLPQSNQGALAQRAKTIGHLSAESWPLSHFS